MKHKYYYDDEYVLDLSSRIHSVIPSFGSVENVSGNNVGVVSLVYATMDKDAAERKIHEFLETNSDSY